MRGGGGWFSGCARTMDGVLTLAHRLYSKGRVLGHKRGKRNTHPNTSLLQIEGVSNKEDAQFYLGKVRFSSYPTPSDPILNRIIARRVRLPRQERGSWLEDSRHLGVRSVFHPFPVDFTDHPP